MLDYSKKYWVNVTLKNVTLGTATKANLKYIINHSDLTRKKKTRLLNDIKLNRTTKASITKRIIKSIVPTDYIGGKSIYTVKGRQRQINKYYNLYHIFKKTQDVVPQPVRKRVAIFMQSVYGRDWRINAEKDLFKYLQGETNKYINYANKLSNPLTTLRINPGDLSDVSFKEWIKNQTDIDESPLVAYLRKEKAKMGYQDMRLNEWIRDIIDERLIWTDDQEEQEIYKELLIEMLRGTDFKKS